MSADFQMAIEPAPGEVAKVLAAFAAFVASRSVSAEVRRGMLVVLDELLANITAHGMARQTDGRVTVEAVLSPGMLEVTVSDNGPPFDPLARAAPDTTLSWEDRPVGGLGIFLVQRLVDDARYARTAGHNVLVLVKRLPAGESPKTEGGA